MELQELTFHAKASVSARPSHSPHYTHSLNSRGERATTEKEMTAKAAIAAKSAEAEAAAAMPKLRSILSSHSLFDLDISTVSSNASINPKKCSHDRHLRFSNVIQVCLVPCRQELEPLLDCLFWHSTVYSTFKRSAEVEIGTYMIANGVPAKSAISTLYQPDDTDGQETCRCSDTDGTDGVRAAGAAAVAPVAAAAADATTTTAAATGTSDGEVGNGSGAMRRTGVGSSDEHSSSISSSGSSSGSGMSESAPGAGSGDDALSVFPTGKTDIELNRMHRDTGSVVEEGGRNRPTGQQFWPKKTPTKTPMGNGGQGGSWNVQWKKAPVRANGTEEQCLDSSLSSS